MQNKSGLLECLFHLGIPSQQNSNLTSNTVALSAVSSKVGTSFYAPYNLTLNRVAFNITALSSPVLTVTGGITDSSVGIPINYLSSTTSTTFTTGYNTLSISDFTCTAGTEYYAAMEVSSYTSGSITVQHSIGNYYYGTQSTPRIYYSLAVDEGLGVIIFGYNNGVYTQWYGLPYVGNVTRRINATATNNEEVGAKINLPDFCLIYRTIGIIQWMSMNVNHTVTCSIYESDATTLVTNATSTVSFAETGATSGTVNKFIFYFGNVISLYPNRDYYVSFTATGTAASSQYTLIHSVEVAAGTTNAFDAVNIVYRKQTSISGIEEFPDERLQIDLILEQPFGSFRGTKAVT